MARHRRKLRLNDPGSTRDLILEEATRIIARGGVEDLKVKDIADAVGIQPPSVYRHFANREAIISALALDMVEEVARFLGPDPALENLPWMHAWARSLVWCHATRPAYSILLLREMGSPAGVESIESGRGPPEEALTSGPMKDLSEEFLRRYRQGVEQGLFRARSGSQLTALLSGAVVFALVWPFGPQGRRRPPPSSVQLARLQDDAVAMFDALTRP